MWFENTNIMENQTANAITSAGTDSQTVYINELLCYVTYSHKSNNERFHKEIINLKFEDKAIIEAKNLLWELEEGYSWVSALRELIQYIEKRKLFTLRTSFKP